MYDLVLGCIHSHPGLHVALRPCVGHPWTPSLHPKFPRKVTLPVDNVVSYPLVLHTSPWYHSFIIPPCGLHLLSSCHVPDVMSDSGSLQSPGNSRSGGVYSVQLGQWQREATVSS